MNIIFKQQSNSKQSTTPVNFYSSGSQLGELILEKLTENYSSSSHTVSSSKNNNKNRLIILEKLFALNLIQVNGIKNFLNQTLLHFASENNDFELCEYLLKNGGDCLFEDNYRQTPLVIAAKGDNLKLVKLFCREIVCEKNLDLEKFELAAEQNIRVAIYNACDAGNLRIVEYLFNEFDLKSDEVLADKVYAHN